MSRAAPRRTPIARAGEPVWEIAELFPEQGDWTEQAYLALKTRRLVEFDNGTIEVLTAPTKTHQLIVYFLCEALKAFVGGTGLGGAVLFAGYRLKVSSDRLREPDVLLMTPDQNWQAAEDFTTSAELVMEVVSPDDPQRDYVTKRRDYADAGIPEYWIVDAAARQILVLRLEAGAYVEHGRFGPGQRATSHRLAGYGIDVDAVLAQGQ